MQEPSVKVQWEQKPYRTSIQTSSHYLSADEPLERGGNNTAPEPGEFLLASLGTCTAITLRMYAERKNWDLQDCRVSLKMESTYVEGVYETHITYEIVFIGNLDEEQKQRLMEIAGQTHLKNRGFFKKQ